MTHSDIKILEIKHQARSELSDATNKRQLLPSIAQLPRLSLRRRGPSPIRYDFCVNRLARNPSTHTIPPQLIFMFNPYYPTYNYRYIRSKRINPLPWQWPSRLTDP